ncbi:AEX-3 domain-containing protein [Lipomyces japonicus]|uniref:AEX-3 domain-containing protein n=1 Tax=Lipomyces japonicus TaxID=56871 RepID=UPI0034CEF107
MIVPDAPSATSASSSPEARFGGFQLPKQPPPIADFFFIAGVDEVELNVFDDQFKNQSTEQPKSEHGVIKSESLTPATGEPAATPEDNGSAIKPITDDSIAPSSGIQITESPASPKPPPVPLKSSQRRLSRLTGTVSASVSDVETEPDTDTDRNAFFLLENAALPNSSTTKAVENNKSGSAKLLPGFHVLEVKSNILEKSPNAPPSLISETDHKSQFFKKQVTESLSEVPLDPLASAHRVALTISTALDNSHLHESSEFSTPKTPRSPQTPQSRFSESNSSVHSSPPSPLRRNFNVRRAEASKLKKTMNLDRRESGHARKISNYDSVIPSPEPIVYSTDMHPLERKLDPALLDVFPHEEDLRSQRGGLPDYVPMFAFPSDIQIKLADSRPRSTWHDFVMTNQDGDHRFGTCITVWVPVPNKIAAVVELLCEQWRNTHMSESERDFAKDLGVRLASQRTILSELLESLSNLDSGDIQSRKSFNEQITETEERIKIIVDLLKPVRRGVASKIGGVSEDFAMWVPRVYGLISRDECGSSFRLEWLKALLHPEITANPKLYDGVLKRIPMEYAVAQLLVDPPILTDDVQLKVNIGQLSLYARNNAPNELPMSRNNDLYPLFRCLGVKAIIELFEAVLAEGRIVLVSKDLSLLASCSQAIVSLIYPFKWQSVFIPVLPQRLSGCLGMPVPFIIGLHRTSLDLDLPDDDFVLCDLDANTVDSSSTPPLLPTSIRNKLQNLLLLAAPLHSHPFNIPYGTPAYYLQTFPHDSFVMPDSSLLSNDPPHDGIFKLVSENSSSFRIADPNVSCPILNAFAYNTQPRQIASKPELQGPEIVVPSIPSKHNRRSSIQHIKSASKSGIQSFASNLRNKNASLSFAPGHKINNASVQNLESTSPVSITSPTTETLISSADNISDFSANRSSLSISEGLSINQSPPVSSQMHCEVIEGHILRSSTGTSSSSPCAVCFEVLHGEVLLKCSSCSLYSHSKCLPALALPCLPTCFHRDRVRVAFVKAMSSMFLNYRKYRTSISSTGGSLTGGKFFKFESKEFLNSRPKDQLPYLRFILNTQAGVEFINSVESHREAAAHLRVFDEIVYGKRKRGKASRLVKATKNRSDENGLQFLEIPISWKTTELVSRTTNDAYFAAVKSQVKSWPFGRWPARLDRDVLDLCKAARPGRQQVKRNVQRKPVPGLL